MIWSSWAEPVPPIFIRFAARALLHRGEVLLGGLVRRLGVDPQDELVERQPATGVRSFQLKGTPGVERRREEVGQGDDDRVGVALLALDVEEALRARAARLVHDDERPRRELVLLGDARDQARHLVGAAAGARRDHELDRAWSAPRPPRAGGPPSRTSARPATSRRHRSTSPCEPPRRRGCDGSTSRRSGSRYGAARRLAGSGLRRPVSSPASRSVGYRARRPSGTGSRPGSPTCPTSRRPWPGSTSRSSSVKWAKRPCLSRYSRTGLRGRPSTMALVLP